MEFGSNARMPSWVPAYPGAKEQGNFSVRGDTGNEFGQGGNYSFTTPDPPSRVISFYQDKAREMGMEVNRTSTGDEGGIVVATSPGGQRSLHIIVGSGTSVNVTYGEKR
jgi:hypothetical protein